MFRVRVAVRRTRKGGWGGLFLFDKALELHLGVAGGEAVLHRRSGAEGHADALDVGLSELLGEAGSGALHRGAEGAYHTQAEGLAALEVADHDDLHLSDDGTDVGLGGGGGVTDLFGEIFDEGGVGLVDLTKEHGSARLGVLAFANIILYHNNKKVLRVND